MLLLIIYISVAYLCALSDDYVLSLSKQSYQHIMLWVALNDRICDFSFVFILMQIYVWVGCNTAKFGHLYAAATTRPVSGSFLENDVHLFSYFIFCLLLFFGSFAYENGDFVIFVVTFDMLPSGGPCRITE